jgi:hypothetical protein
MSTVKSTVKQESTEMARSKAQSYRKYYEENSPAIRAQKRKHYAENAPAILARQAQYKEKNAPAIRAQQAQYYELNAFEIKRKHYCLEHNCAKSRCTDCMTVEQAVSKGLMCIICRVGKTRHYICDNCREQCIGNEVMRIEAIIG